jgi:mono/diheme cytochrome c family protein
MSPDSPQRPALGLLAALLAVAVAGCGQDAVSYSRDVAPILADNCSTCHAPEAPGFEASGFSVHDYEAVMRGGNSGPVIRPGDPGASRLVVLIEGRDPALRMPHVEDMTLTEGQVATIRRWIERGAKND